MSSDVFFLVLVDSTCCLFLIDLGQSLLLDLRIITLATLVIILNSMLKVFTYWSDVQVQRERSKAQAGEFDTVYFISNNAFYTNENVTYCYDLRCK